VNLIDVLVAVLIAIGIAGIIVPVLPGTVLVLAAVLLWAWSTGGTTAWVIAAIATLFLMGGTVVKFAVPGKQLKASGVPNKTLWIGAGFAFIGFFVIPVIGIFIGFVVGIYVAERMRVGATEAWPSSLAALRAVGVSILIELAAACLAALTWVVGLVVT
jgi:uncharacterized protein YqgC (DUF456 family)